MATSDFSDCDIESGTQDNTATATSVKAASVSPVSPPMLHQNAPNYSVPSQNMVPPHAPLPPPLHGFGPNLFGRSNMPQGGGPTMPPGGSMPPSPHIPLVRPMPPPMGPIPMDPMMAYLIHQLQHQIQQAQQFQQALLQMQTFQNQMFTQLTTGTASTAVTLCTLSKEKPMPNLTIPLWTPSNKQEWVQL
eukprot:6960239-Ditylum_brightwellii.AAC.1